MIGRKLAKIQDYTIGETKGGKPQVIIQFTFLEDGKPHSYTWYGTLSPDNDGGRKGIEITLKALKACGLDINNIGRIRDLTHGPNSGMLNMEKELAIELQEEKSVDNDGKEKTLTRVQWVNDPDGYVLKRLSEAEVVNKLQGMDFTADFMKIMGGNGQGSETGNQNQNQNYNNQNQNGNQNGNYKQNGNGGFNNNQNQNQNQNGNYNNQNGNQNHNGGGNFNQNSNQNQNQNQNGNFKSPF